MLETSDAPDNSDSPPGIGFQEFLSLINAQGTFPQWVGKCCVHDDKRASMVVRYDEDTKKVLVKCFACNESLIGGLKARGWWPIHSPNQQAIVYGQGRAEKKFTYEWLTKTVGIPPEPMSVSGYALSGMWDYYSIDKDYLGRVLRYDSLNDPEPGEKRGKQFRPQFFFNTDGGGKWMYKMPPKRPLYGLPSLKTTTQVLLVEGEKTADAAQKLFPELAVISPMGGLQGLASSDLSPLQHRDVILWSDADQQWESNLSAWRNVLFDVNCTKIRFVKLPEKLVVQHPKWDLADAVPDWLNPRDLLKDLGEFLTADRDPILNIIRAEDLKTKYALVVMGEKEPFYVYLQTGRQFSERAFNAMYSNLTVPRDLGLPASYFKNARDRAISYSGTTYHPGKEQTVIYDGGHMYNEYQKPVIQPIEGDVQPFLDHVNWMFSPDDAQELLCRFANMVQNPARRPLSAFVIKGAQGLGKNLLFEALKPLVGATNFSITDPDSVLSQYNYYCVKKVMVVFNEMTDYERHELYDRLKPIITDEMMTVRQKYMPEYQIPNYAHIFCMTNHERPIRLPDENERRFYIAEAVPKAPRSQDYYDAFVAWRNTHYGELLHYLLNYSLGSWLPEARPKLTEAKRRVVTLSKSGPTAAWEKAAELVREYELYTKAEFSEIMQSEGVMLTKGSWKVMDAILEEAGGGRVRGIAPLPGGPSLTTGAPCYYVSPFEYAKWKVSTPADITRAYYMERGLLDEKGKLKRGPHNSF